MGTYVRDLVASITRYIDPSMVRFSKYLLAAKCGRFYRFRLS
jgi:hypothetical protein